MHRTSFMGAAAAIVMLGGVARAGDHIGKVVWENDPEAGLARARREGRPAMLAFSAEW
jgi:hypothetical protein